MLLLAPPKLALARTPGPLPTPAGPIGNAQIPLSTNSQGVITIISGGQSYALPTVGKPDEGYVPLSDQTLARLFDAAGMTLRETGTPVHSVTLYSPSGHYLDWRVGARRGFVDGNDTHRRVPAIIRKRGQAALSMRAMVEFLNLRLRPENAPGTWHLISRLEKISLVTNGDREISLHASGPLNRVQITHDGRNTTISMTDVDWGFDDRSFQFGDVTVDCAGSGTAADPATVTVNVPVQWKTEEAGQLLNNELGILVLPDFPVNTSQPAAQLTGLSHFKNSGETDLTLDATAPIHEVWRYDPATSVLTIDIPQATMTTDLSQPIGDDVLRVKTEQMQTSSFPFVRVLLYLQPGSGFNLSSNNSPQLTVRVAPLAMIPNPGLYGGDMNVVHYGPELVVLDPGHGGSDPGAINRTTGLMEKTVTLDICRRLKADLEARGVRVVMTRYSDRDVSWAHSPDDVELGARVHVANVRHATVFLSIHCNASVSSSLSGTSYHWYKRSDLALARALDGSLKAGTGFSNDGLERNRFYVLRLTHMPAVLVETAFITNPSDEERLAEPQIRQKIADDITEALTTRYAPIADYIHQTVSNNHP